MVDERAGSGVGISAYSEADVLSVVTDIIIGVCDIGGHELTPDRHIGDLGIDSLLAGEIISQTELALNIDIDFQRISDDWSELTLSGLVAQIWSESSGRRGQRRGR